MLYHSSSRGRQRTPKKQEAEEQNGKRPTDLDRPADYGDRA